MSLTKKGFEECPTLFWGVGPVEKLLNRSSDLFFSPRRESGLGGKAISRPSEPDPLRGVLDGVVVRDEGAEGCMYPEKRVDHVWDEINGPDASSKDEKEVEEVEGEIPF